jgi:lipopolysaccharide/colanic/teichoic acid biosynthesis glycosyltransferase
LVGGRLVRAGFARGELTDGRRVSARVGENVIIVGANHFATCYLRLIEECARGQERILAIVDPDPRLRNQTLGGHRVIGTPEDLSAILSEYRTHGIQIHKVVVTIEESQLSPSALQCLRGDLLAQHISVEFLAERLGFGAQRNAFARGSRAALGAETDNALSASCNAGYWRHKRALDIIIAGTLLVLLSPTLIMTALLVRLAIGSPVIFWQRRIGRLGGEIFVFKFRTMRAPFDAEGNFREKSEGLCLVGALLRRSHIDELPQVFNILRGEMSLIGPRPLLPEDQPSNSEMRLLVRPGITGWAQVHGGSLITTEEKNDLDEYYIRHASPWLDVKIALKTIPIMFTGDRLPGNEDTVPMRNSRRLSRA